MSGDEKSGYYPLIRLRYNNSGPQYHLPASVSNQRISSCMVGVKNVAIMSISYMHSVVEPPEKRTFSKIFQDFIASSASFLVSPEGMTNYLTVHILIQEITLQ